MKKMIATVCVFLSIATAAKGETVASPDGNLSVTFSLTAQGVPTYQVDY